MDASNKILIADDHPLFRAALKQAVHQAVPHALVVEADTLEAAQNAADEHTDADLILLDLHMPDANGFSGLVYLRGQHPGIPVVMVSGSEEPHVIRKAMDYGASGFIPKSASLEVIAEAIQSVMDGEEWLPVAIDDLDDQVTEEEARFAEALATLTPQQFRVLMMLTEGLLNKQIAYELNVSEATIKAHVTAIHRSKVEPPATSL